jgi:hypothetical protein
MKISAALALLLLAGSALAADNTTPQPDYTRDGIQRVFVIDLYQPSKPHPFAWENMFAIDWTTLGTRMHFRPLLAPLQGSFPTTTGLQTPNPFILTGTTFPYTDRTWNEERALTAERRKVEKIIRRHAHIVVAAQ